MLRGTELLDPSAARSLRDAGATVWAGDGLVLRGVGVVHGGSSRWHGGSVRLPVGAVRSGWGDCVEAALPWREAASVCVCVCVCVCVRGCDQR